MKILLKQSVCGGLEGRCGQVVECHDEDEAKRLIAAGVAEEYQDTQTVVEEQAAIIAQLKAKIEELEETKSKKGK